MKKIYILLMNTNTLPSKLIKFITRYEYSHVGISLEKNCNIIYSFGRKKLHSILNGGFTIEYKDGKFFNRFNKTKCKIYEVNINDEQYKNVKNILNNMESNIDDYKYDFLGIIPRFFGIPVVIKHRYVCSYFVAFVLEKAKICNFNKKVCLTVPKDFENLKEFNEIYTGNYKLYKNQ